MIVQDVDSEEEKILRAMGGGGGSRGQDGGERCSENDLLLGTDGDASNDAVSEGVGAEGDDDAWGGDSRGNRSPAELREIDI